MPFPLHKAAGIGDIDTARLLLESKICDANERTNTVGWGLIVPVHRTPLHYAAMGGHCDITALLIQHGADLCSVDWVGRGPLHVAAEGGHCDVAALLIQHGADPSSTNKRGWTPLHYAAYCGNCDVAALLIQHGADPSSTNKVGWTSLSYAAGGGHCDVASLLIQHGADPCSTNKAGWKPSDLARRAGNGDIYTLLRRFESDHIQEFMITRTLEHVSAEMSLDNFFLPTDGINNNFPGEAQKQKVQRLKRWANSNNLKTIQEIKAGLTAQGREELCVIAAKRYATVAKDITDMSRERYESLCKDLSTAQFMFQERPLAALEIQSQEISKEHASFQFDVFLIHSGEDKRKVEEVLEQLEALGIRCCYGPRDFLPGKSIFSCIEDAVEFSRCTVVMVSESFRNSEWCQHEREMAEAKAKDTKGRYTVIPVLLDSEPSDLPRAYRLRKFIRADNQDFISTLVETVKGPTAAPSYGQLRRQNEVMSQQLKELQGKLESITFSN